jgi:hypothetical protein
MHYNAATITKLLYLVGAGLAVIATASPVSAAPNLQAIVCRDTPASLTITRPQSDSVINESRVTLSGDVTQSSQLEIYVDDAFNSVESLPSGTTNYTTTIQLSPGTHTVKIVAIDSCQVANAASSIVLTYQPISTPSVGGQVSTSVAGAVTGLEEVSTSQGSVFERFVVLPLVTAGESLNLVTHSPASLENDFSNTIRFSLIVIGLLLVGFSQQLQALVLLIVERMNFTSAIVEAVRISGRKATIGLGLAMIIGVFLF